MVDLGRKKCMFLCGFNTKKLDNCSKINNLYAKSHVGAFPHFFVAKWGHEFFSWAELG